MSDEHKRLDILLRHIHGVQEGCQLLGMRLMTRGEASLGRALIANGMVHDNSKFRGLEWQYLNDDRWPIPDGGEELFKAALHQHVTTNPHHPEYWDGGVAEMPRLYLAEMLCDWKARSSEQGTDITEWVKEKAPERFDFSTSGRVYKELKDFLALLLERKFV